MYYLLGYKYFNNLETMEKMYNEYSCKEQKINSFESGNFTGFGNFLNNIDPKIRKKVSMKS